ncbi:MAG TPA: hypothetical protein HA224_02815 [Nanoarchaeota archaeon]|nr:hypothetical protein [Nanoarchaeota archaeon]
METPSTASNTPPVKFYMLKAENRINAMRELFPSVFIISDESDRLGFRATPE